MVKIYLKKRAQIAYFVIIGIVIIVLLGIILSFNYSDNIEEVKNSPINKEPVQLFVESCIKDVIEDDVVKYGFGDLINLENHFNTDLDICLGDMDGFGFEITRDFLYSDLTLSSGNIIIAEVTAPIKLKAEDVNTNMEKFHYEFKLSSEVELEYDNGVTNKDYKLISPDNNYKMHIPRGTKALDMNGNLIDKITIKLRDKETYKSPYNTIIGDIIYELKPDGATFEPPLEVELKYDENLIPSSVYEEDLKLSYYYNNIGVEGWVNYQFSSVDTDANIIFAGVDHFTAQGATGQNKQDESILACDATSMGSRNVIGPGTCCKMEMPSRTPCAEGYVNCDCYSNCATPGTDASVCSSTTVPSGEGDYTCKSMFDSGTADGFFSLVSFNGSLYGGAFGYHQSANSMLYSFDGKVTPGLKGVTESVCVMREFNGYLYANTEAEGRLFRSKNGKDWGQVFQGPETVGCGLTVYKNHLYATFAEYNDGSRKGYIYRSSDGINWVQVHSNNQYLRDIVAYDNKIYAFGYDNNDVTYVTESTDGVNWVKSNIGDRVFRGFETKNGTLWAGAAKVYGSSSGTPGIYKINDNNKFEKVFSSNAYKYFTYVKEWKGVLFAATAKGFKDQNKGSDLLYSPDNGTTWKKACSVSETGIWDMTVHDDQLYFATMNYGGKGFVYNVTKKNNSVANGTEKNCTDIPCFIWKEKAEHSDRLVVLMPNKYTGCELWMDGDKAYYHRTENNQCAGKLRPHYYFPKLGREYSGKIEVKCDDRVEIILHDNPAGRCEGS